MNMKCLRFSAVCRRLTFLFVFFLSSQSAQAGDPIPSQADLTRFFEIIVFGAEYGALTGKSTVLKKWASPIRANVSALEGTIISKADGGRELKLNKARPKKAHVDSIRKLLTKLVKLTGVKTEAAKKTGRKPNYFIKFVPRLAMHAPMLVKGAPKKLLRTLARSGKCYFLTAANPRGEITWATIVVNNERPDRDVENCLREEMIQTLGLPNDSNFVKPSIFNDKPLKRFSDIDLILAKTLYDKRLKPGMPRLEAVAKANLIIGEALGRLAK